MAARGKAKRQAAVARPSWTTWMLSAALLLAAAAGIWQGYRFLAEPERLPLRVVEVKGEFRHLDRADIERTVVAAIDGGFFGSDMHQLRRAVLQMPWVADVSIRRIWPDTLRMRVTEQVPLARWGDAALVNTVAEVFAPASLEAHADLVRLHGPDGSARRVVAFYQAALDAVRWRGLEIVAVEQDARRHWWLTFADGLVVSLGRERVEHRLAEFVRVYPGLVARSDRRPVRVDMRYAHGFAVRWKPAPPAAPEQRTESREPA